MKREIKFRGLFINKSKWVYGFYTNMIGKSQMVLYDDFPETEEQEFNQHFLCQTVMPDYSGWSAKECHRFIPVIPETVSQYTERKDRNGKEIYEGDVCTDGRYTGVVKIGLCERMRINCGEYPVDYYGVYLDVKSECNNEILCDFESWEIIGNIYENPELLK